ncbi:hypothetical protein [Lolliginicoccus levis]|uniref:hypothetical protein n=1 Tax=Lolliginicoccus levis TaxID=2919542 RepID=UPI00241E3279|nr:hypothetical protein [Lolliginicoccus levis]
MPALTRLALPALYAIVGATATVTAEFPIRLAGIVLVIAGIALLILEMRRPAGQDPANVAPTDAEQCRALAARDGAAGEGAAGNGTVVAVKTLRERYPGLGLRDAHHIVTRQEDTSPH